MEKKQIKIAISQRDSIDLNYSSDGEMVKDFSYQVIGCKDFVDQVEATFKDFSGNISDLALPEGDSHSDILIRELILKIKADWNFPYNDEELCHCRVIPTEVVDQAIISGAHSVKAVNRITSAGTGCGTCRKDIEALINHRLAKTSSKQ